MKTSFKKLVAGASLVALVAMNTAFATQIGTGSITGGSNTPINSTWDGTSTPVGTVASGSLNVQVSAQVMPTLNLTISTGAINFGVLTPGVAQTGTLTIDTTTNAKDGLVVSLGSSGLKSASGFVIGANLISGTSLTSDTTDYYKVSSSTTGTSGQDGNTLALNDIASTQTILNANNVLKSNATTTVNISAMAGNLTEAGDYTDTLIFTVTGTF